MSEYSLEGELNYQPHTLHNRDLKFIVFFFLLFPSSRWLCAFAAVVAQKVTRSATDCPTPRTPIALPSSRPTLSHACAWRTS